MTPATNSAKVLVTIYVAAGDEKIREVQRYVWSNAFPRSLAADVHKFVGDQILCAEFEIMDLQTMMDGDALPLDEGSESAAI
jgi:hypothetical protein